MPASNSAADAGLVRDALGRIADTLSSSTGGTGGPVVNATTNIKGVVELATNAETITGTDDTRAVTPAGLASAIPAAVTGATEDATIAYAFGATNGVPISPWKPGRTIGPNHWRDGNFYVPTNTAGWPTPYPINPFVSHQGNGNIRLVGNGTTQEVIAHAKLRDGDAAIPDITYRLEFDVTNTLVGGWGYITATVKKEGTHAEIYGQPQRIMTHMTPTLAKTRRVIFDFRPVQPVSLGPRQVLELSVKVLNNNTGGEIRVENIVVSQTEHLSMPLWVANHGSADRVHCSGATQDPVTGQWGRWSVGMMDPHATFMDRVRTFPVYSPQRTRMPDPWFTSPTVSDINPVGSADMAGGATPGVQLRVGNNDQIFQVKSLNGNYEGYDSGLVGNLHDGETNRADTTYKADYGNGLVPIVMSADGIRECWRFQADWPSQLKTDSDPGPFANVDHLMTFFADGMMRMDRTTTFLRETTVGDVFEWMSSHDKATPNVGRMGRGLTVLGETDSYMKAAVPAAPTVTAETGGSLPAGTVTYRVTATTAFGETTPSPVGTVAVVASGRAVVTWPAATGATGYRIYGRTAAAEGLLATVAASTTSWEDTGAAVPTGRPPLQNSAVTSTASTSGVISYVERGDVTWGVYKYEGNWCVGNIYDRDAVLNRPGVAATRTRLSANTGSGGVVKNYLNLYYDTGSRELTVPAGTEWTATHWSFVYRPRDPENYHDEIAVRAASLEALKSIYPND